MNGLVMELCRAIRKKVDGMIGKLLTLRGGGHSDPLVDVELVPADGPHHLSYMVIDPHYYHEEDSKPTVETGPKRPRSLSNRLCTPLNGDDFEFN